jgi:hypothetical protein
MPSDKEERPATSAEVRAIRDELEQLRADADRPATAADVQAILVRLEQLGAGADRTVPAVEVEALRAEVARLRAEVNALRGQSATPPDAPPGPRPTPAPPPGQHVTLDQIGAMVHRSKRSLEHYRKQMPPPRVRGRRGQAHLWDWAEVRPWLEATFGVPLPEHFPGLSL